MKTSIIIILASILMMSACKEKIEIKPDESTKRIVIEANITTEKKSHIVKISKSTDLFHEGQMPPLSDANVMLSDGNTTVTLFEETTGVYKTPEDFAGVEGKTYTLTVVVEGKTYTASSYMPYAVPADSISFEKTNLPIQPGVILDPSKTYYNIKTYCQDPADITNYYMVDVTRNGVLLTDTISMKVVMNDVMINGSYLDGYRTIQIEAYPGDEIKFVLSSITADYYIFISNILLIPSNGSPFSGPPANVSTNFSGGALGFFSTQARYTITKIIK